MAGVDSLGMFNNLTARQAPNGYSQKTTGDFESLIQKARHEQDDKKLKEACQEIEAVFINQMLRRMRATVPENGLIPVSSAEKIYREMLDEEYSKVIAKSRNNFGLADMLYKELHAEQKSAID